MYAMKRLFIAIMLILLAFGGQAQVKTKRLKAYLSTTNFYVPGMTPYLENAIAFDCRTAVYKEFEPGKFKSTIEIQTVFRDGEKISAYSKIALDSPVVTDTANLGGAFIDQQRFSLPNGEYEMEISITDMNSGEALPMESITVKVDFVDGMPAVSDILLFDSYSKAEKQTACTKSGFDFLPRVYPFLRALRSILIFILSGYGFWFVNSPIGVPGRRSLSAYRASPRWWPCTP